MFSETNANINITNPLYNVTLKASDRFLKACPIKYVLLFYNHLPFSLIQTFSYE